MLALGLGLIAALGWGTHDLLVRTIAPGARVLPQLAVVMLVAALVVTPFGIGVAGSSLLNMEWMLIGLGIALLSSAIPYSLEMYSLKHLPKQTFSILLSLEPAVGAVQYRILLTTELI